MTLLRSRRALQLTRILSGVILTAALLFSIKLLIPPADWTPPSLDSTPVTQPVGSDNSTHQLRDLAVIWERDLRQSVVDAPPAKPQPKREEPRLAIRLVGTVVEAQRRYGIFKLANHRTVVKALGETVGRYKIVAIERGRATLRDGERTHELRVPWYDQLARGEE